MIVNKTRAWTILRVSPADFWVVGDMNARFCPPIITGKAADGVTFTTQPGCDAGAASTDCTQDQTLISSV